MHLPHVELLNCQGYTIFERRLTWSSTIHNAYRASRPNMEYRVLHCVNMRESINKVRKARADHVQGAWNSANK